MLKTTLTKRIDTQNQSDVDITPMLDVVFIMLIFFIVTASFVRESGLTLNHPAASPDKTSVESIVLEIDAFGEYRLQNRILDEGAIRATIVRLKAENPDAAVSIRVDKRTKTDRIVGAIDALHAAQVFYPSVSLNNG